MSTTTTSSPAAAVVAAAAAPRICFNGHCKEPISDPPAPRRRGWRLRSGDYADLCDRCLYAFEQGNFCDTFHGDATGWRNCETCGKRLHCGCIVSAATYYLLDAGGVDCVSCARKTLGMAPNQMLSSPVLMNQQGYERRDFTTKSWRPTTGPFSGQWRQGTPIWNLTSTQTDLQQRLSYEFDRPSTVERLIPGGRLSISGHEKKFEELPERIISTNLNNVSRDKYANGSTGSESVSTFKIYRREEGNTDVQESGHLAAGNDPSCTRKTVVPDPSTCSSIVKLEINQNPCVSPQPPTASKEESPSVLIGLAASLSSANGSKDLPRFSSSQTPRQMTPHLSKQFYSQGVIDTESQSQMRNGRPRVDTRTRTQLLPRYWPRITDQELQQISGDSKSVITPLFEKMLSASDAGRIGRLVLPKKCAEAYFPTISQPEGLPLKVQDACGKEWVFQFRFWPNNNSRMYVLEGVTPCIQSMQLQAGDTVTFSRIDPEGKLIMGFRKASNVSSEQDSQTPKVVNGTSTPPEGNSRSNAIDLTAILPLRTPKGSVEIVNPINEEEVTLSKDAKEGFIQKDGPVTKSSPVPGKRKASTLGSKNKRLRIENEDSMELKLTWEEAQELLRPPPNNVPNVVVIEGHEVEEYEEAPVLGKRTYFTKNQAGENFQWAQCDACSKWRKLPVDALLPFRWTCSDNNWDPDYKRLSCSSVQELSLEQILDLVPTKTVAGTSKRGKVKAETSNIEASGGLDTLANIALGEGENQLSTSQQTTKHPRHRPGCSCIVCIQPPSGKGPKHKQTCTCNVCLTVKRRFRTLMLRREKRQSEKDAENARKQQQSKQSTALLPHVEGSPSSPGIGVNRSPQKSAMNNDGFLNEGSEHRRTSSSPLKAPQIDLNIQPEREEESSPRSDVGNTMRLLRDATT